MSDTGERRDALTRISALPVAERRVLAALAIVGRASLSGDELAELAEVHDVTPLVADLERLELIRGDEKQRYRGLGRIGDEIRQTDTVLSTGERLLQYMTTLAKGGQLTPERLLDDAEAILGLTEWAAECQQWEQLLELVKTLQACFGIESRVEEWLTLLDRGHSAARALDDRQSQIWVLRQLAAALAGTGDMPGARQRLSEADELEAWRTVSLRRLTLWTLGVIAFAAAGGAAGYAIGDSSAGGGPTTTVPVTVTRFHTVTLPATTVLSTTTVTATAPPPPPPASPQPPSPSPSPSP